MNLILARFVHGILGAILGAGLTLCVCWDLSGWDFSRSLNIKAIIFVSVVSFFVSFCCWERIVKLLTKTIIPITRE